MNKKYYTFFRNTLLTGILAFSAQHNISAQVCIPTATQGCGGNFMIQSVSTAGGIKNFTNNATGCSAAAYADYTDSVVKQDALKKFDLKVTWAVSPTAPAGGTSLTKVYVDWNANDIFEASEQIKPTAPGPDGWVHSGAAVQVSIPITIPGYAKQGLKRLRIVTSSQGALYTPSAQFNPCAGVNKGEYEDYTVEVVNPCVPPNVISVANVNYKSADIAWTEKPNRDMYEYLITPVDYIPGPGISGFSYTTSNTLEIDTFKCNTKYYVLVRVVCDTAGRTTSKDWEISAWIRDSFTTEPCCYAPELTIDQVGHDSARASWNPIPTAYGYETAISQLPDPPQQGEYTTNTSKLFRGLSNKTTHFIFVRSRCTPTPLSNWTKGSFKTNKGLTVNQLSGAKFSIDAYPNPLQDKLTVQVNGTRAKNAYVTVVDLTGKVVYHSAITTDVMTIDAQHFARGVYVVKYADDEHNEIMKVVK